MESRAYSSNSLLSKGTATFGSLGFAKLVQAQIRLVHVTYKDSEIIGELPT